MSLRYITITSILALLVGLIPVQAQSTEAKLFTYSQGDLWTWSANSSAAEQVTEWGYNGGPILAPDGSAIAYLSVATEAVEEIKASEFYPFAGAAPTNIWIMDTVTQAAESVTNQTVYPTHRGTPAWSPTGRQLAWLEYTSTESGSFSSGLVVYDLDTRQTQVIAENVSLGFQDGGLYMPPVQWGQHGISRLLSTFMESGAWHEILEIYDPTSGNLSEFILATNDSMMNIDSMNPVDYVWVEHQAKAMIAVLTVNGSWYALDPLNGNRYILNQPPSLVAWNDNGTRFTPLWQPANSWQIAWQVDRTGSSSSLPFVNYRISEGVPALSPDGTIVAWNNRGTVHYRMLNDNTDGIIRSSSEEFSPVGPLSVVWTPMRWVTNAELGNPMPQLATSTPIVSGADCQLPSRLSISSFVSVNPGAANNVRTEARVSAPVSGQLESGGLAQVKDGPVCVDGFRWWFVSNEVIAGWTAEGNNTDYWLVPLAQSPFLNTCPLAPRLRAGNNAVVLGTIPNVLRDGPDANGTSVIGEIPAGGTFRLLGDSLCGTDGRRWYPVNYNGELGWTAEGEGSTYWLEPR